MKRIGVGLLVVLFIVLASACKRTSKTEAIQLPVIYIFTDTTIQWKKYTPCDIAIVNNCDSIVWNGKIKCRGGVSAKYYKHSYSVKLSEEHSLCGLPENRSWILNANYIDKTFMRHKLCYDLFNSMGNNDLAPQCAYALVRCNEKKQGLYVVMQRLDQQVLGLDKNDKTAVIFKEPNCFYPDGQMPDSSYIGENYHGQTYPDFETEDRSGEMRAFRKFIEKASDEEFYNHIGEWIDIRNLIDWTLLLQFTNNGDGVNKNFYLYRKDSNTPYRIAIWDCDHSFGRDGDNERNMLENLLEERRNILINRMMESPKYQKALKKRYHELRRSGIFSYKNIERMMRENDPYVRAGLEENLQLWPFDSKNYFDAAGYDEEYALILEFIPLSLKRLDTLYQYHE